MKRVTIVALPFLAAGLLAGACSSGSGLAPSPTNHISENPPSAILPGPTSSNQLGSSQQPSPSSIGSGSEPWILFDWFLGRADGIKDLALVHEDGTERHAIAAEIAPDRSHSRGMWSHDGTRIAFMVGDLYASSVWTARADGTMAQETLKADPECRLGMSSPDWSPDDRYLLFVCNDGSSDVDPHFRSTIERLELATNQRTPLEGVSAPAQILTARWSRDGRSIVYQLDTFAADLQTMTGSSIRIVPAAGGESRQLTDPATFAFGPEWSPRRDEIVFSTNGLEFQDSPKASNVWRIGSDGSDLRRLTTGSVDGSRRFIASSWSPDGDSILLVIAPASNGTKLDNLAMAVIGREGGEPVVTAGGLSGAFPRLQPAR